MSDVKKTKKVNKFIVSIIAIVAIIIFVYIGYIFICKAYIYPIKYGKYVIAAGEEYNVDPYLIFAIIKQESKFDKMACSKKYAKGLMQILDSTASEIAIDINGLDSKSIDLFDAKTNIYIGTKYIRTLIDRYYGNIRLAICAYNAGLGNVDKWKVSEEIYYDSKVNISNIPFEETKEYLVNILNYYERYVELYN